MGMRAEAHLVYGVVIEDTLDYEEVEDLCEGTRFEVLCCGWSEVSEHYVVYHKDYHYGVEWEETYRLKPGDLEVYIDTIRLCSIARDLGVKTPRPGWHLVAYYG